MIDFVADLCLLHELFATMRLTTLALTTMRSNGLFLVLIQSNQVAMYVASERDIQPMLSAHLNVLAGHSPVDSRR